MKGVEGMLASGYQLAQKGSSSGSAIAISQDGLVLTNHHVVDNCKTIEVTSGNGRSPASLKASDRATDLAPLQSRLVFSVGSLVSSHVRGAG